MEQLDRELAIEPVVMGGIYDAHAALAEALEQEVSPDARRRLCVPEHPRREQRAHPLDLGIPRDLGR
jgi:hypothetical protein